MNMANKFNSVAEYKSRGELVRDNERLAQICADAVGVAGLLADEVELVTKRWWWRLVRGRDRAAISGLLERMRAMDESA